MISARAGLIAMGISRSRFTCAGNLSGIETTFCIGNSSEIETTLGKGQSRIPEVFIGSLLEESD